MKTEADDGLVRLNDSLGPIPEAVHSLRVGDAEYKDAWTASQMHEERERCYALGVAAERERWRDAINALAGSWDDPAEAYGMRLALNEGLKA